MLIALKKLLGARLLGRLQGKRDYAKVCEELAAAPTGETVLLDFGGVTLLSGSWANAMLVPLYRRATEDQVDLFPVLVNIAPACLDDLLLVAEWNHQCYLHAEIHQRGTDQGRTPRCIGPRTRVNLESCAGARRGHRGRT